MHHSTQSPRPRSPICFEGCTGGRGEAFPLTPGGSLTAPQTPILLSLGLGSGQTAQTGPVLAG